MNPIMMSDAQFYFALSVPLVGILVNVVLISMVNRRIDRLGDRVHAGHDVLMGKLRAVGVRLTRIEEHLTG
jgi:hypothetical protein